MKGKKRHGEEDDILDVKTNEKTEIVRLYKKSKPNFMIDTENAFQI